MSTSNRAAGQCVEPSPEVAGTFDIGAVPKCSSEAFVIVIPGEPRGKGRHRAGKSWSGKVVQYTDAKTSAYENLVALAAQRVMTSPLEGPVSIDVTAYLAVPKSCTKKRRAAMVAGDDLPTKKPDIDNVLKAVKDGLNHIAFNDDSQVTDATARKRWALETGPCVVVTISSAAGGVDVNSQ